MNRRKFCNLLMLSIPLALLAGCGGGKAGAGNSQEGTPDGDGPVTSIPLRGVVSFSVAWPPLSRSVLSKSNSLVVTLTTGDEDEEELDDSALEGDESAISSDDEESEGDTEYNETQTLNRPSTHARFENVPVGPARVIVQAYDGPDGSGSLVGGGSASIVVQETGVTQAQVELDAEDNGDPTDDATGTVEVGIVDSEEPSSGTTAPTPPVQRQTLISISLDPNKLSYPRDEPVNIVVWMHSPSEPKHLPIKNAKFALYYEWQDPGKTEYHRQKIADLTTGSDGRAIKRWRIPGVGKWNVRLHVVFEGNEHWQRHEDRLWRIPIG
jgi:hypothetical protein